MGNAVKAAAQELRQQIIDDDAEALKVNVQEIQLKNGEVICGEHRLSWLEKSGFLQSVYK
jgi:hypothetical protein